MSVIFKSINPFDQSLINEYELMTNSEIETAIDNATHAFKTWRNTTFSYRSDLFRKLASVMRMNKEEYALTISLEMGKILNESRAEIEKCAVCCEYYADNAERFLQDEIINTDAKNSLVAFDPIGAVLAVMPWNFPFWQVIRFAVPALMAGNVGLLKHARNVTGCAIHLEQCFIEAGFPEWVFQSLVIESGTVEQILSYDIVQGVALTGSEAAGASVAAIAGRNIKKSVLELGGSDPFIILEDADIAHAAKIATRSRMQNAGQSCIAAKRFIVTEKVKYDFLQAFKNETELIIQGDQLEERTTMGPVSSVRAAVELEMQQVNSIRAGASLVIGGGRVGANYAPTIISDVKEEMPGGAEELFGPVAAVISVSDADHAIEIANRHRYGLAATIFTADTDRAYHLARKLQCGSVFINSMVKSDPRLPFGGVKKSGYGRELANYGLKEFVNVKTIVIN